MTITSQIKQIFILFMMRDGWTHEDATRELTFLLATPVKSVTKEYYITTCRIGAKRSILRIGKLDVWMTWENAQNHGSFEEA
jgi:hypothetical protein